MEFKLPDIGEGVHEGEITKWLIQPGQTVNEDQPMVEVMTDKATVEIPSPVTGVVESLLAKEGQTVLVGAVILKITEKGKAAPAPVSAPSPAPQEPVKVAPAAPSRVAAPAAEISSAPEVPFHVLATPATRKLARDLSVSLGDLQGSGPKGRVTKEDVQLAYEGQQAAAPQRRPCAAARRPPR